MNVTLRELDRRDLPRLNAWRNDPELIASLGNNFLYIAGSVDEAWYESYLRQRDSAVRLAIEADGAYIGNVNLTGIHRINRSAEFSILIGEKEYWGKGAATQATRHMLDHAFGNLGLHRVWLTVLAENARALKLYEKTGFVREGVQKEAVFKQGRFHDLVMMAAFTAPR